MGKALIVLMAILAAACSGPAPKDSLCIAIQPIQPTMADVQVMSRDLVDQILAVNETWARICD